jgi:hypothetical protein
MVSFIVSGLSGVQIAAVSRCGVRAFGAHEVPG